ncbi:MAG: hypothetical protein HOC74_29960 [Gemmatimonadetes bacterium]|jgi:hypothetical protein|nr:hypothetical protein [Gemmatimonadota bacterium]
MSLREHASNPVLTVGGSGEWDAGALGTMSVLKVADVFHMYYEAWSRRSEAAWDEQEYFTLQIGHATSSDGMRWTRDPVNPVIPRGGDGDWDHHGTWDPFVLCEDGVFKMWYGGGANDYCDWAYATSEDGRNFEKQGKISWLGNVEDIHIVHDRASGQYHVYYWNRAYEPMGLFHATSPNETDFNFAAAEQLTIEGEDYPGMYKFTHVVQEQNTWYMFYGNFVRPHCADGTVRLAISNDGSKWNSVNKNLLPGHDGELLRVNDTRWFMYYGPQGYFDRKDCTINLTIYDGKLANLAEQCGCSLPPCSRVGS